MATSRQERMQERMRGAHSHQVADTSFNFEIPLPIEEPSSEEPTGHDEASSPTKSPDAALSLSPAVEAQPVVAPVSTRPAPNTSAKRSPRSPQSGTSIAGIHTQTQPSHPRRTSPSTASAQPRFPETNESSAHDNNEAHPVNERQARERSPGLQQTSPTQADQGQEDAISSGVKRPSSPAQAQQNQQLKSPEQPQPPPISSASRSHRRPRYVSPTALTEEVDESPADAPGSGRRRPLQVGEPGSAVHGSSALLQRVLEDLDDGTENVPEQSSPLERAASRKSGDLFAARRVAAETRRSTRLSGSSPPESVASQDLGEEPSPSKPAPQSRTEKQGNTGSEEGEDQRDTRRADVELAESAEGERPSRRRGKNRDQKNESEKAPETSDKEAAKSTSRKRPRRAIPSPSPQPEQRPSEEEPQPKRRRGQAEPADSIQQTKSKVQRERIQKSPTPEPSPPQVPQKQPKQQKAAATRKPTAQNPPKPKKGRKSTHKAGGEDRAKGERGEAVPITVQRFTKPPRASDGPDELNAAGVFDAEIPFANRAGVNAIDVLSELCEGLIAGFLGRLEERAREADDAATKRELKTKSRTMEAFQEELRTRLLEHTIALDTLHALRKRVKVVQKEKLGLREEILRIRAERDQLSLRMDAIRIKHEVDSKEALRHISLSSAMHDIDLAVERGHAAPELSPAEQKMADLANLEFLISKISGEVCNKGNEGGTLKQIKEFNAFLERAASVLEGR